MQPSKEATITWNYTVPIHVRFMSFDIWNTLLRGNKEFTRPRLALIFELLDLPGWDVERLRKAYLESSKHFDRLSETTGIDYGMDQRLKRMFGLLGIERDIPGSQALASIQRRVGELRIDPRYAPTLTEPDLLETLGLLRASGYKLGLLSNTGMDDRNVMQPVLEHLGIWQLCETAIFSSEDGRAKPNLGIFSHMAKKFDAWPAQVLHIGDNPLADYPARKAGLESVLYAPEGNDDFVSIASMKELLR